MNSKECAFPKKNIQASLCEGQSYTLGLSFLTFENSDFQFFIFKHNFSIVCFFDCIDRFLSGILLLETNIPLKQ